MTGWTHEKMREKFQTPPGFIKTETQQAPEPSNNPHLIRPTFSTGGRFPPSVVALPRPWRTRREIVGLLGHLETAMETSPPACVPLFSTKIGARSILGAVSWPAFSGKENW